MSPETKKRKARNGRAVILVVEDDEALRELLRTALSAEFSVSDAADGEAAMERARELRPDVVVLDVMLPGENGLDVARRVRDDPGLRDTAVLVITAFSDIDREEALAAGASGFLSKPFDVEELIKTVKELL